ncbi:aldose 1-epimerase family protein [Mitsuokella sp.]|uniref:aldose 1-epimerase family protein n=1 Tax=Mitsuokella sp. TaxID=2049034 RepID=UPI003D7EF837
MLYTIENDKLCVQVRDHGAELRSIKERADETEYLWNGDPTWWKYSSPVLFPIIGKVRDGKYRVDGKEYELPSHGLGRISDFKLVEKKADRIAFSLLWSEESLKKYPWKFELLVAYELHDKAIKVIWTIRNHDDHEMIYSIGAHGAYRCPIVHGESFSDCYLEFNKAEDAPNMPLNENGQFLRTKGDKPLKGTKLSLNFDEFKNDVLAYHNLHSDKVTIRSTKSTKSLSIIAKDFPFWGFWTPVKGGAPFLCIEPWHGHADYEDFDGDFSEREGSERLAAGEEQTFTYTIEIG